MIEHLAPHEADLHSRVALVTGAGSGLGRRFAETIAAAGATVVAAGRRLDRLELLTQHIESRGGKCLPVQMDVSRADQLAGIIDGAESVVGPISILVNNAAMADAQYATKMSATLIDEVIATNLRAPFVLSCEVARRAMNRKTSAQIVNISSMGAYIYDGNGAALYSITKAAVNRMTEVLAVEWAKFGINVNCIAPGMFSSEMVGEMLKRIGDRAQDFPRRRIGDPAQLDTALLFLLDPASDFVTGAIIKVDDAQTPR